MDDVKEGVDSSRTAYRPLRSIPGAGCIASRVMPLVSGTLVLPPDQLEHHQAAEEQQDAAWRKLARTIVGKKVVSGAAKKSASRLLLPSQNLLVCQ